MCDYCLNKEELKFNLNKMKQKSFNTSIRDEKARDLGDDNCIAFQRVDDDLNVKNFLKDNLDVSERKQRDFICASEFAKRNTTNLGLREDSKKKKNATGPIDSFLKKKVVASDSNLLKIEKMRKYALENFERYLSKGSNENPQDLEEALFKESGGSLLIYRSKIASKIATLKSISSDI